MQIDPIRERRKEKSKKSENSVENSNISLKIKPNEDGTFLAQLVLNNKLFEESAYSPLNAYRRVLKKAQ